MSEACRINVVFANKIKANKCSPELRRIDDIICATSERSGFSFKSSVRVVPHKLYRDCIIND